jgi:hypothetical protein
VKVAKDVFFDALVVVVVVVMAMAMVMAAKFVVHAKARLIENK